MVSGHQKKGQFQYWRLFFWVIQRISHLSGIVISFSIFGFHFRKTGFR
ncbi:MAG: DUF4070 domain-containing protein [Candidatus Aminicenantaceae bacterium]